jgi:hypothetical protein
MEKVSRRAARMERIKKGPGVFVYNGQAHDTEWIPTPLRHGKQVPLVGDDGVPVVDGAGRQVYHRPGEVVRDMNGRPMLGGTPKMERRRIDVLSLWGVDFPEGREVVVDDPALALKCRAHPCLEERELGGTLDVVADDDEVAKLKAELDALKSRLAAVSEAAPPPAVGEPGLEPVKRGPGRPRKVPLPAEGE